MDELILRIENKRKEIFHKQKISIYVSLSILLLSIIFLIFGIIYLNGILFILFIISLVASLCVYFISYATNNKKYLEYSRNDILSEALKFNYGDDYIFKEDEGVDLEILKDSGIINNPYDYVSEKFLSSTYKNVKFISSRYRLDYMHIVTYSDKNGVHTREEINHYYGKFIRYEVKRNNNCYLSILEKGATKSEPYKNNRIGKEIEFESINFNKKFNVRSTDESKAMYLITPQVQCDLYDFDNAFLSNLMCVLCDRFIYIFMDSALETSKIGLYTKFNEEAFKKVAKEYVAPKILIDALHLDDDKFMNESL